jgi:hypothetical protein
VKLEECLARLPLESLHTIADKWSLEGGRSTERLARHLARHLLGKRALSSVLTEVDPDERLALKLIALCGQGRGLVVEQCHQKLNQLTRKWRRNGARVVANLMDLGLVYTDRVNYRQVYHIPDDLREELAAVFAAEVLEKVAGEDAETTGQSDPLLVIRLLYMFLSYLARREVRLTQTGSIFKRAQKDLVSALGLPDLVADEDSVFVATYPPSLALLYYYCRSRSLLAEREGVLVQSDRLDGWLELPVAAKLQDFYEFWQDAYLKQDTDLETMYGLLQLASPGRYLAVNDLIKQMSELSVGQSWQGLASRAQRHLFYPLQLLGMVENLKRDGAEFCRLTGFGRRGPAGSGPELAFEEQFFVQANFDVLVPKNLRPDLLWQVESMADLVRPDQVMLYRLSRQSVYRSLSGGMNGRQLMEFLTRHSRNPLAPNIVSTLEEWCSAYGRLRILDVLILQCDDAALASELKASRRISGFIVGELTPRDLIVDRARYQELVEALSEEGHMPRTSVQPATR